MVEAIIKQFKNVYPGEADLTGHFIAASIMKTIGSLPDRFISRKFTPINLFLWKDAWFDVLVMSQYPKLVAENSTHLDPLYGNATSSFLIDRFEKWMIQEKADNESHIRMTRIYDKEHNYKILLPSLGWTPEDYTDPNSINREPLPFNEVFKRKPDEFCPHRPDKI